MRAILLCLLMSVFILACNSKSSKNYEFQKYNPPVSFEDADKQAKKIVSKLTLDEKLEIIGGHNGFYIKGNEQFNLPYIYMADATQGVHIRHEWRGDSIESMLEKSTSFPAPILLASTWNKELAYNYAKSVGEECRAGGVGVLLGPGMNIYRISQCGRNFEYFGEDPFLAARMIENFVTGLQSTGTIATLKHFAANNTDFFRRKSNSIIDERTLHEIYLPAFKAGIDAGAMAVMTSYNLLNDEWCGQSEYVINDVLRNQLGFKWMVMTDWWSVWDGEKVIKSGMDLEMPKLEALKNSKELIEQGKVKESDIDRMVVSILRTLLANNMYKNPVHKPKLIEKFPEHEQIALQTAREGIILLTNKNNILPVDKDQKNILLTGKYIEDIAQGGGAAFVEGYNRVNLFNALKEEFGNNLIYKKEPSTQDIMNAELVLLSTGTYDSEGWDRAFNLPDDEEDKIIQYVNLNPNTIIIVNSGSGIKMANWKDKAAAIVYAWYPGQIGNKALAQIISGKINPSGKLPVTIEKEFEDGPGHGYIPDGMQLYTDWAGEAEKLQPVYNVEYKEGVFVGYRWYDSKEIEPLFPFGHGLSYTTFEYSNIELSQKQFKKNKDVIIAFTVKNSGEVKGKETAQLYIRDIESSVERPFKELKGFSKIDLLPGESKRIEIKLSSADFSFYDVNTKSWIAEPGKFEIMVGSSSKDIHLNAQIELL